MREPTRLALSDQPATRGRERADRAHRCQSRTGCSSTRTSRRRWPVPQESAPGSVGASEEEDGHESERRNESEPPSAPERQSDCERHHAEPLAQNVSRRLVTRPVTHAPIATVIRERKSRWSADSHNVSLHARSRRRHSRCRRSRRRSGRARRQPVLRRTCRERRAVEAARPDRRVVRRSTRALRPRQGHTGRCRDAWPRRRTPERTALPSWTTYTSAVARHGMVIQEGTSRGSRPSTRAPAGSQAGSRQGSRRC